MSTSPPPRLSSTRSIFPPASLIWIALVLALGHAGLATLASQHKSTTADELAHITGGYTFNHWNDYRLHPENGNLPQRWQALPATLAGSDYPPLTSSAWQKSVVWLVGYDFFFHTQNDPDWLLLSARAMNSLFGAATSLLVFFWSYRLWGQAGALVSLVLCILSPTMLAHSGLATSDMAMAFFLVACPTAYWWQLHDGRRRVWLLSALLLGLAAVAKFTAVLLVPIFGVLALGRILQKAPLQLAGRTFATLPGKVSVIFVSSVVQGVVAAVVVWAFFGFRFSLFNPTLPAGVMNLSWDILLSFGGWKAAVIQHLRDWHLLPEGWLSGLAFVFLHAQARGAFLDGDYGIFGWVEFFPKTFLYKTPPSLLIALLASALLLGLHLRTQKWSRWSSQLMQVAPLVTLFGIYWLFSITSHLNIGHRHILPTYPVLFVFCGALGWAANRAWRISRRAGLVFAMLTVLLIGWQARAAAGIYPHYLAYFSPLVGGPSEGYQHLVDSSLDWGQDLPALQAWLSSNRRTNEPVYISYFGSDEPARFVPDAVLMPRLPSFDRVRPWYWCEPGVYAISATLLQQVYTPELARWSPRQEMQYQQLRLSDPQFHALKASPNPSPELLKNLTRDEWANGWTLFEGLRFARLCRYLRTRTPDATAGYSILIFRLSRQELAAALEGNARTFSEAVQQLEPSKP